MRGWGRAGLEGNALELGGAGLWSVTRGCARLGPDGAALGLGMGGLDSGWVGLGLGRATIIVVLLSYLVLIVRQHVWQFLACFSSQGVPNLVSPKFARSPILDEIRQL